jgi:hypothetical protein
MHQNGGMHETARQTWLNTMTDCASVQAALSHVKGTQGATPEHVYVGMSRMAGEYKRLV